MKVGPSLASVTFRAISAYYARRPAAPSRSGPPAAATMKSHRGRRSGVTPLLQIERRDSHARQIGNRLGDLLSDLSVRADDANHQIVLRDARPDSRVGGLHGDGLDALQILLVVALGQAEE